MGTEIESSWENERLKEQLSDCQHQLAEQPAVEKLSVIVKNIPIADTGDYDGVVEIRRAGDKWPFISVWSDDDEVESLIRSMVDAYNAQPAQAGAVVPDNVLTFLHGQGPLDGVWFGEPHPIYQGKFWWRAFLPAAPKPEGEEK